MADIIIKHINYTLTRPELLRLNKYFDIQDGEFILFTMMKKSMDEVEPYLKDFKRIIIFMKRIPIAHKNLFFL